MRLPILWHIGQQRWLHLNTVFLGPDDADWDACASTWNDNCIFCHNTGPEPRQLDRDRALRNRKDGCYDSEVGELGIACEACHGPGGPHADREQSPLTRYAQHLGLAQVNGAQMTGAQVTGAQTSGARTSGIVHPDQLDQERSVSVCGQCHGARLPQPLQRMAEWLTTGPTFRAGDRLLDHVEPIVATTPVHGASDPEMFALRFWGDGTPRLTAYEYQGIVSSACYQRGKMTCQSCHAMHAGDPRGQLRPDLPGDQLCTQCHEAIGRDKAAHTHHAAGSPGSACVECHMPKIVYGILDTHRSHRIENPDAARDAANARPHACTLCHVDRTLVWAGTELRRLWSEKHGVPVQRRDGAPLALPDAVASMLCGDAAQRAIYARAFGRPGITFAKESAAALRAHLAITMGDGYPSVRWFAQEALQALERREALGLGDLLARVDHTGGPEARRKAVFSVLDAIAAKAPGRFAAPAPGLLLGSDFKLDLRAAIALTDLQGKNVISIGE